MQGACTAPLTDLGVGVGQYVTEKLWTDMGTNEPTSMMTWMLTTVSTSVQSYHAVYMKLAQLTLIVLLYIGENKTNLLLRLKKSGFQTSVLAQGSWRVVTGRTYFGVNTMNALNPTQDVSYRDMIPEDSEKLPRWNWETGKTLRVGEGGEKRQKIE